MAFTSTDLANVEAAIVKLAVGTRVIECEIDGDRVRYQPSDLDKVRALRDLIRQELASTATGYSRVRKCVTDKGY
jgi:hypothetical protein